MMRNNFVMKDVRKSEMHLGREFWIDTRRKFYALRRYYDTDELMGSYYKLAVLDKYILEHYGSSSKGRSLILDSGGSASTC